MFWGECIKRNASIHTTISPFKFLVKKKKEEKLWNALEKDLTNHEIRLTTTAGTFSSLPPLFSNKEFVRL